METKKYSLPNMIVNRYVANANTVILNKNRSKEYEKNPLPKITEDEVIAAVEAMSETDNSVLRHEMQTCWTVFFDEAFDRVYPLLDEALDLKLD